MYILDQLDRLAKGGMTTQEIFNLVAETKGTIVGLAQNDKRDLKKIEVSDVNENVVGYLYGEEAPVKELMTSLSERYVAFSGTYREGQGWQGYRGSWPTKERCLIEILRHDNDWWHIVDTKTMEIVEHG